MEHCMKYGVFPIAANVNAIKIQNLGCFFFSTPFSPRKVVSRAQSLTTDSHSLHYEPVYSVSKPSPTPKSVFKELLFHVT